MRPEYYPPMLDIGSPRVFNVNDLTRQLLTEDSGAAPFFQNRQLNTLVLIKDTVPDDGTKTGRAIGTKLYFPFNEANVYEGGRTIFRHDKHLEAALFDMFGRSALPSDTLADDLRKMALIDRLPSLDPFLMKDAFLNEGFTVNDGYFVLGKDLWEQIETFILVRFESVVQAAFPDAQASDEKARLLVQKIWEAHDLVALKPLVDAFRLPEAEALEIFSAWKGVNFYSFQYGREKPKVLEMAAWLQGIQLPIITAAERAETRATMEQIMGQMKIEWQKIEAVLQNYQTAYDKMFKTRVSSTEFVVFLRNSAQLYWELGNSLGKLGQATYCWDVMTRRFPGRKLPWEPLREGLTLLAKILRAEQRMATASKW